MRKNIIIDYADYQRTLEAMERGETEIKTSCLEFFDFRILAKGYNVRVIDKDGKHIDLLELMQPNSGYTDREMKPSHDLIKLLLAGEFKFKTPVAEPDGVKGIIVGRHVNGIFLNDLEYILEEEDGPIRVFTSENDAKAFLRDNGLTDEDMETLVFQEIDVE